MTKLTGDELIEYGFRRMVEELQELRGAVTEVRSSVDSVVHEAEQAAKSAKLAASKAENIEQHMFTSVGIGVDINNLLEKMKADTLTTSLNVIRIEQELKREEQSDADGSEQV